MDAIQYSEKEPCAVCLEEINEAEECKNSCGHSFCKACIDNWLDQGKSQCPLCRQDIKYLETKHSNYRIIIKTNTVTQEPANQRITPIMRTSNVIPVRRHVFYTLRYSLYLSFIFSVMQGWFIHNLRKSYRDLLQQSIECHRNNTELNDIILENHYFQEGDFDNYLIMDKHTDILRVCYLPIEFMQRCFT